VPIFTHPCAIELRCERPKRLFGFDGTADGASSFPTASHDLGDCGLPPATATAILTHPADFELQGDPGVKGSPVSKQYFIYMLASKRNGTLYVGVTNDLLRRALEHKDKLVPGFTKRYGVSILVWYEIHGDINTAIEREKQIKGWNRAWKIRLIEANNSGWNDLTAELA
jgi:putative endonuclease